VNLQEEERIWGGHAVKDHVGKSPDELIAEQESNRQEIPVEGGVISIYRQSESTYPSWEAANDFVNRLLQAHTEEADLVQAVSGTTNGSRIELAIPQALKRRPMQMDD